MVSDDPVAVVSVMPLDVLRARRDLDLDYAQAVMFSVQILVAAIMISFWKGVIWRVASDPVSSLALSYRRGRLGAFWTIGSKRQDRGTNDVRLVFPDKFEAGVRDMVNAIRVRLRQHGVGGPWIVMTSLIGLAGSRLRMNVTTMETNPPVRRSTVPLPDIIGECINEAALLSVFKAFWRVFGRRRPTE